MIVQVPPPAATTVPFVQVPPVIEKLPVVVAPPPVFATVGAAVNVSAPVPLLVTVIVPLCGVLVPVTSDGVGPEKPATALAVVPAPVNSIAPTSTEPFAFLLVPKKSKVGARV
jgi:hypothetical protein